MVRRIPESSIKYLGRRLVFNPLKSGLRDEPDGTLRPMRGEFNLGKTSLRSSSWQSDGKKSSRCMLERFS
jgi:hypothetical protein